MIREATAADLPLVDTFLTQHSETSMYLRGNLAAHGIGLGEHPHSTQVFLWEQRQQFGVFAVSKAGYLMAQMPGMTEAAAQAFARQIAGRSVLGMTGAVEQVELTMRACGLAQSKMALAHDEPLFSMDLTDLTQAQLPSRAAEDADLPVLEQWFASYLVDTGQDIPDGAATNAAVRAREAIQDGPTWLLLDRETPVAMARINARAGDMVQIGGVFVPDALRGRGYGGQVTQAALAHERRNGARRAILFANNTAAARAYERIGFSQIGWYRIALLQEPAEVRP